MKYFPPKEQIVYETKLSQEELFEKLSDNIEQDLYYFGSRRKPYIGTLSATEFNIKKESGFLESSLDRISGSINIKGYISQKEGATTIKIDMKLNRAIVLFMCVWLVIVSFFILPTMYFSFTQGFNPWSLIDLAMLFVGIAVPYGFFRYAAAETRKDLEKMMQAEKVSR